MLELNEMPLLLKYFLINLSAYFGRQRDEVLVLLLPGFFFRTSTGPEKVQKQQNRAVVHVERSKPHFHQFKRTG